MESSWLRHLEHLIVSADESAGLRGQQMPGMDAGEHEYRLNPWYWFQCEFPSHSQEGDALSKLEEEKRLDDQRREAGGKSEVRKLFSTLQRRLTHLRIEPPVLPALRTSTCKSSEANSSKSSAKVG